MGAYSTDPLGLAQVLPWLIGLLGGVYALRVVAALLLLAGGRWRPGLQRAAVACAPAALRPWLRRAVAGGLLGVALSGVPALASTATCAGPDGIPVLDRAAACAATPAASRSADTDAAGSGAADTDAAGTGAAGTGSATAGPAAGPGSTTAAPSAEPAPATYTVLPGDSLWSIAAGLLGPQAADTAIAGAWPEIWSANASSIGTDPALIRPGTTLAIPIALAGGASR